MHDLTPPDEAAITYEEAPDPTFALRSGVVCWLDLLGLTEQLAQAVRENREPAFVAEYLSVLRPIYKSLEYDFSGTEFQWSAFTDSIVVSVPTDAGHPETTIGLLCDSVAEVQFRLALRGWFARGAVAVGPLHASREFVIGSGMLSAYKLEGGDAVVPRVIVDETVRDALPSFLAYYAAPGESPQNQYFALDDDGQVFINYLFAPISLDCDPATLDDLLAKHRSRILAHLARHAKPGKLRAKYLWLAAYHNWFCAEWRPGMPDLDLAINDVPKRPFRRLVPVK